MVVIIMAQNNTIGSSPVHQFYGKIVEEIKKNLFLDFIGVNDIFDNPKTNTIDALTKTFNNKLMQKRLNPVSENWIKENLPSYYKTKEISPELTFIENYFYYDKNGILDYNGERDWLSGRKIRNLENMKDNLQYGLLSLNKYKEISGKEAPNAELEESEHVWVSAEINIGLLYSHSNSNYVGDCPGAVFVLDKSVSKSFDRKKVQTSSYAAVVRDEIPWNYVKHVLIPEKYYADAISTIDKNHGWNKGAFGGKRIRDILKPIKGDNVKQYETQAKIVLSQLYHENSG